MPARSVSYSSGVDGHLEQLDLADGWSELWFDDYAPFQRAYPSPEWAAMEADGATLFMAEKGIVIGREYVQKDDGWKPRDYGALGLSEDQIRDRLRSEGYGSLAADRASRRRSRPRRPPESSAFGLLIHLVTLDESSIDARPEGVLTS